MRRAPGSGDVYDLAGASQLSVPHRRHNPLTGGSVLVSVGRMRRPWQGQEEPPVVQRRPAYDPDCYLCPGNARASGEINPDYRTTYAFTNDFPSLTPDADARRLHPHPLFRAQAEPGTCRVLCFHPRHDLTLAQMRRHEIRPVVDLWAQQLAELSPSHGWVQIFENQGEAMGASNPHPHGQVWATTGLPTEPAREDHRQRDYLHEQGVPLLCDYADIEAGLDQRVVAAGDSWLAVVPYWALWPFETLLLPRRHVPRLTDLTDAERDELTWLLHELLGAYDNLFDCPFPYSMGWHGAPGWGDPAPHWQLHAHFYPPLLRSASVRKFMVGYEMLANPQRDLTPEEAADRLRGVRPGGLARMSRR